MRSARGYSEKASLPRLFTLVLKGCVQNQRQGMNKEELVLTWVFPWKKEKTARSWSQKLETHQSKVASCLKAELVMIADKASIMMNSIPVIISSSECCPFPSHRLNLQRKSSPSVQRTLNCSGMGCSPSHSLGHALQQWGTAAIPTALNFMSRIH